MISTPVLHLSNFQQHFDMETDVSEVKTLTHAPYGTLQPFLILQSIWEDISLDFIVGLFPYRGNTVILVVVDRFSKATHFEMLLTHFIAIIVVHLFCHIVCKHHGMPRSIVSDRDPVFMSRFWQELFKASGIKLRMSSAYYLQSNGQTEQGLYLEDSTWEDLTLFKQTYPDFHLEDTMLLDQGGDDTYEDELEADEPDPNE
ncbi:hypothetical protein L6164_028978 [Bauhinia variegata]|uniref:Uncharacterized protein n=1 Tax=Bauhinia variegata TaxID=167791 RepID=A0ACB9L8B6_BAUVA|nr:hypothetical protein L6164_028978 [Bauhinia variegata]